MEMLNQKKFFKKKNFEITSKGLKIKENSLFTNIELTVCFEDMTNQTKNYEHKRIEWIVAALLCLAPAILAMMSGVNKFKLHNLLYLLPLILFLFFLFLFIYLYTSENYISIINTNKTRIQLFNNKSTEKQVKDFIDRVLSERKNFIKNKYANIDYDLPYEYQINTFRWLKDEKIISEEEYEKLKEMLRK